jgi:hypothetical protein
MEVYVERCFRQAESITGSVHSTEKFSAVNPATILPEDCKENGKCYGMTSLRFEVCMVLVLVVLFPAATYPSNIRATA